MDKVIDWYCDKLDLIISISLHQKVYQNVINYVNRDKQYRNDSTFFTRI